MSILMNKKAAWLVGLALLCVGLVVGLGFGSTVDEADAAKKKELKTLWANINADGLTPSYKGLTGNRRTAEGRYEISFNRDVSKCATVATIKNQYGEILAFTRDDTPKTVHVEIVTSDHSEWQDGGFALVVNC
jgi:hypothetical protein